MSKRRKFTLEERRFIYGRTCGFCHVCRKALVFEQYGRTWHVDHSVPLARSGTNRMNNLLPACATCNTRKGVRSSRAARRAHGFRAKPLSVQERSRRRSRNAALGGGLGAIAVAALGGPFAVAAAAFAVCAAVAGSIDPDHPA